MLLNAKALVHTTTINSTHIYISVDKRIKADRINVSQHCSLDGCVVLWQRCWYVHGLWINTKMPSCFSHQFSAATKLMVFSTAMLSLRFQGSRNQWDEESIGDDWDWVSRWRVCHLIYLSCYQVFLRQCDSVSAIDQIRVLKSILDLLE